MHAVAFLGERGLADKRGLSCVSPYGLRHSLCRSFKSS